METPDTLYMLVSKLPNGVADRWNRKALMLRRSQQREPSLKDFIEFFDEETVLVNNPIFSREAITAYVGTQEKSDNQRKRRSNNKKYGSFATDINHHQPEAQEKCILCCHKHDLDNCEEHIKKSIEERSKFLARKKLCYGCYKPISCHTMQELAMTDEYARFVRRSILLVYIVTIESRKLEMIILVHQIEHRM